MNVKCDNQNILPIFYSVDKSNSTFLHSYITSSNEMRSIVVDVARLVP